MNEETKRLTMTLRERLSYSHTPHTSKMIIEIMLLTCKEMGLRFVDLPTGFTDEGIVEIEL